ncbi:MAG: endo-1,4-beta-xylanase [Planctomycetales bacterium]|nr:endo-1,4-beta-xylanase [Planctomycetales bacterium]
MATLALLLAVPLAVRGEPHDPLRPICQRKGLVVGAMILDSGWKESHQRRVVSQEFGAATIGAYWTRTRPTRTRFDWALTDEVVRWAAGQGMAVHLHPLVYASDHNNPQWLLDSDPADARGILAQHISTATRRYRGLVEVWDVVNEVVAKSPQGGYRDSWWTRALGEDFVIEAFRLARQGDPAATLLYNEYDIELNNRLHNGRWRTTQKLLQRLHAEGLVDGLGWQLHTNPSLVLGDRFVLEERMRWVREELGLKNFVTELDMPIAAGSSALGQQADAYQRVAEVWLKHSGGGWLQTWGVSDRYSWLGEGKRPLLLDEQLQPKPAYFSLQKVMLTAPDKDAPQR